jgi:hypothetical protein
LSSALIMGVDKDAAHIANAIAARIQVRSRAAASDGGLAAVPTPRGS